MEARKKEAFGEQLKTFSVIATDNLSSLVKEENGQETEDFVIKSEHLESTELKTDNDESMSFSEPELCSGSVNIKSEPPDSTAPVTKPEVPVVQLFALIPVTVQPLSENPPGRYKPIRPYGGLPPRPTKPIRSFGPVTPRPTKPFPVSEILQRPTKPGLPITFVRPSAPQSNPTDLFCCELCPAKYGSEMQLGHHQIKAHPKCSVKSCNILCSSRTALRDHQVTVHGRELDAFLCPHCGGIFRRKAELTLHLVKIHQKTLNPGRGVIRHQKNNTTDVKQEEEAECILGI